MTQDKRRRASCGEKMRHMDTLRNYQREVLDRLLEAWRSHRSVMVQMPTGTGKTVLLAEVIRKELRGENLGLRGAAPRVGRDDLELRGDDRRVLVVAHRRELLEQIRGTVDAFGIDREEGRVVVESIQKLSGAGEGSSLFTLRFSLIIVDEAHHALAETYRTLWERWPEAKFLGLTATPCRLGGAPFTDLFDVLVQSWSVREFIGKGWLSDLDYISVRPDSVAVRKVAGMDKRGADGDYQTKQAALVLDTEESVEHLYQSYKKFADGKKGIVYAINRSHAQHIAAYYRERGVRCAVVDGKTPAKERSRLVEDYRRRALDVLVNCEIFGEGFDVPEVEFIQLARPTLSLALYLQQVGRGMRVSPGKDKVVILDQVGLCFSLGLPTAERDWQAMFLGEARGRGIALSSYRMTGLEMAVCKTLVNGEMVRLADFERMKAQLQQEWERLRRDREAKARMEALRRAKEEELSKAEWHGSLGIFREGGRYGVRRLDGTCLPAVYEQVQVLPPDSGRYLALARLPKEKSGCRDVWTVITKEGKDLHARMEGDFGGLRDDVFEFRRIEHGRFVTLYWDARYDRYHRAEWRVTVGGVEFFVDGGGEHTLRSAQTFKGKFTEDDVLYNGHIMVVGKHLFVKGGEVAHYTIAGFLDDCVIVEHGDDGEQEGWLQVTGDGAVGNRLATLPKGMTSVPLLRKLGLQRELRMKYGESGLCPRDYQTEMLDGIDRAFRRCKSVLLQVPSGAGKTFVASRVIRREMGRKGAQHWYGGILIVAHRVETMAQISRNLNRCGLAHTVVDRKHTGPCAYDGLALVDAANVQPFIKNVAGYFTPSMVVIDEAHAVDGSLCECLRRRYPNARLLGLSATPCADGETPLAKVFGKLVPSWSVKRLVAKGWLRDVDVVSVAGGTNDAERLCQAYKEHADGKRGILFADDSRQARRMADCYMQHGIKSEVIGFGDSAEVQEWKLNEFEAGMVKVLVCTDYFSDGMRCPDVDFVQLAKGTGSLNTYLHQVGCAMHPGKGEECGGDGSTPKLRRLTVLDHAGLCAKFGLPTDERDWKRLFNGERKRVVRKKVDAKRKGVKVAASQPAVQTKWQVRMQRLMPTTPREDVAQQRI